MSDGTMPGSLKWHKTLLHLSVSSEKEVSPLGALVSLTPNA